MLARALSIVLKHEGGYVNHPADPGGETNFGITKRVAAEHGYTGDMRTIPVSLVETIYRKSYWNRVLGDELPWPIALVTFDAAVNSGVKRASEWLQKSVGASVDGVIGQGTLAKVEASDPAQVARAFTATRLAFLKSLKTWPTFGKGWERRVNETLAEALKAH